MDDTRDSSLVWQETIDFSMRLLDWIRDNGAELTSIQAALACEFAVWRLALGPRLLDPIEKARGCVNTVRTLADATVDRDTLEDIRAEVRALVSKEAN